jgi:hypothetical protein
MQIALRKLSLQDIVYKISAEKEWWNHETHRTHMQDLNKTFKCCMPLVMLN